MRSKLFLPVCLLTALGCEGTYFLGNVLPGHAGSGGASGSAGNSSPAGGANGTAGGTNGTAGGASGMGSVLPQFACNAVASQQFDPRYMQAYSEPASVTTSVNATLAAMEPSEKASQMLGVVVGTMDYQDIMRSFDVDIPGTGTIRGYNYRDGGRGVNLDASQPNNRKTDGKDFATVFPTTSVRAASWDLDLERRIGAASGDETAASLNNVLLGPVMNIVRHPYWGRTQETYGEDVYHTGRMATAYTVGGQEYVLGCAKHFAANNIEKMRSTQNAVMNEQTLREIYTRHFEMVVQDGGIGCIMASYNLINGVKSTQNRHLLRDILKAPVSQGGMGFQGFVLSDWWAMPGDQNVPDVSIAESLANEALTAGLDVEMPWTLHYSVSTLTTADQSLVQDSARRVLRQKYRFKTARTTDGWGLKPPKTKLAGEGYGSIVPYQPHEALAEEAELKSAVLLTNGAPGLPVLPLTAAAANIAVVGPDQEFTLVSSSVPKTCAGTVRGPCTFHFATDVALGDRGTSRVNGDPDRSVGPFAGVQMAAGPSRTVTSGNSAAAAIAADTVVVVVGYTPGDEGEEYPILTGGDRSTLDLPIGQNEFVNSVLDLNKPTVIVVESGSIVNLPWLNHANKKQATVWAGYGGLRGGAAIGKLLFGAANFSGKMPMAWPTQAELDKANFKEEEVETTMDYFFGYREYDRRKAVGMNPTLLFPFGHGLSYSSFTYSNLTVPCQTEMATKDAVVKVTVDIENTSDVDGDEVVMLFVKPPAKPANVIGERPIKELKSFVRVNVKAHAKVTAELPLRIRDLRRWEGNEQGKWVTDSGAYTILVGKNADDAAAAVTQGVLAIQGD
ncbi:MAG TPA: glycoside hydrolase family 3 C-terminal domain-containing protein [Polyangiaceae bacterium]|nr:glycoside hydrolase family 3 C-terminal domain-containing protein [Polyangiaceae bacterium]